MAVGGHFADSEVIVGEDVVAALLLDCVVLALAAPANHGFLVAPGGEREPPAVVSPGSLPASNTPRLFIAPVSPRSTACSNRRRASSGSLPTNSTPRLSIASV